ncbi:MAG: pyrroloquinoline quinone biosynthesis protein D [Motiliproteus sp.]|jgi:pyrroloquinoline quinone biosynthesis protein D
MFTPEKIPSICRHFRFQWEEAQQAYVLLYPEGMVKLNGGAGEILACCDGQNSVATIIKQLDAKFPEAGGLSADVQEFLGVAHEQQWLSFS